jgi:lysyl-tRNA synthetase class 2
MTRPSFVNDYPRRRPRSARFRSEPDGTQVAERFELYVDGLELANGFRELGDALEQRRRFEQDLRVREGNGQVRNPLDERLLAALTQGLPDCAGVALGFDRLVMAALRLPSLADAMAFRAIGPDDRSQDADSEDRRRGPVAARRRCVHG